MTKIKIERKGGLAGFGSANAHLQSIGEIAMDELSKEDKKIVKDLFKIKDKLVDNKKNDGFHYTISKETAKGIESIIVEEEKIPEAIKQCVKDEFK